MVALSKKKLRSLGVILLPLIGMVLLLFIGDEVMARPGGGNSFGGGSSGRGGSFGGGGGGGDGMGAIIYLLIRYPQIGIPLLILFIAYRVYISRKDPQREVSTVRTEATTRVHHIQQVNKYLHKYQQIDPHFSKTIFLDFVHHLYYQYHHWRGKPEFNHLAPFIQQNLLSQEIRQSGTGLDVSELVVANLVITNLQSRGELDSITVEIEANYTESRRGHSNRLWVRDQWIFSRMQGVQSKGPDELTGLHCPNCGSHLELTPTGACHHCGQIVHPGTQHWSLVNHRHLQREVRKGKKFGEYAPERGTEGPTLVDPMIRELGIAFQQEHNIPDMGRYFTELRDSVIIPIFETIYASWESQDYQPARPLMTDNLFRSHVYWIEAYKKEGLINRLTNLKVTRVEYARIELDNYYEAFTVRIFASVLDYLERKSNGKLIGGSRTRPRQFSEYWTFARRKGAKKPSGEFNPSQCPNCGAPVDMGMTGICSYCKSKVTTGDFSWILVGIVQDEVYLG